MTSDHKSTFKHLWAMKTPEELFTTIRTKNCACKKLILALGRKFRKLILERCHIQNQVSATWKMQD